MSLPDLTSPFFFVQGSKGSGMEDGSHGGGSPPARAAGGTKKENQAAKEASKEAAKQWQGHPPPGGGGAGQGRPPSSRKISPPSQGAKTGGQEPGRTRKSSTPEPTRVRKSPTPDPGGRVRKSPTPDRTRKSSSPTSPVKGSPKKSNKSPPSSSPRGGSPQKTRPRTSSETKSRQSKSQEEHQPVTETNNEGSHYARPTIIDDGEDEAEDEVLDQMPVISKKEFNRSISEPPEETSQEVNPARKLSEGEGTGTGNLTGMFFQKLIQKEDGQSSGSVYKSNTSLTSQESGKSGQSRASSSPRQSFLHSPAGKTLTPGQSRGSPSPNLNGSTFSINRHKKVELASFDTAEPPPKKREMRFSHGEDKSPEVFESNMIKKAASVAHVESFSKTVKQGTIKPTDKAVEVEKFKGKELLNLLTSGFSDDNYLKITLTNKDYNFIAKQFGVQLLGLGVLKSTEPGENSIKVSHSIIIFTHKSDLSSAVPLTTLMTFPGRRLSLLI